MDNRSSNNGPSQKRQDYINWDEYLMGINLWFIRQSSKKCNSAVISDSRHVVINAIIGPEETESTAGDHAISKILEMPKGATNLYTVMFPCDECIEAITNSGVSEVIYFNNETRRADGIINGVNYRQFTSDRQQLKIDFSLYSTN